MLRVNALRDCKDVSAVRRARVCEYTILATIFGLLFSAASYAQVERETVDFNIPSSALPPAHEPKKRQNAFQKHYLPIAKNMTLNSSDDWMR